MEPRRLQEQAEIVRGELFSDISFGVESLIDFARDFAIDEHLRHEALLIKMDLGAAVDPDAREAVRDDVLDLLQRIIDDVESADAAALARQASREKYLESRRGRDIDRRVVVRARGLEHKFQSTGFHLRGVDLKLRQGEITGVIGENGNGKTTLFRLLVGELQHTAGELTYPELGEDRPGSIDWAAVKRHIAYVPQELERWHGSLEDNLRFVAAMKGITGAANDNEVDFIVERLGLRDELDRRWDELSGGFKLRFSLAAALVWRPRFLALDEPLANLDFRSQLTILRDVRDLANSFRHPIAVLISSQHLHEVEAIADRVLFLDRGGVVFNGPKSEIGADRTLNIYEIGCKLDLATLRSKLRHKEVRRIVFDGMSYVVSTTRELERNDMLHLLLERGVSVKYFRDISRSVKNLFNVVGDV